MKLIINTIFLATLIFGSGCATVLRDSNQPVAFTSAPAGVTVALNGIDRGVTPVTVSVKRATSDTIVSYKLKDFHPVSFVLDRSFGKATFGNILLGGGIGAIVDAASGKNATYPENVHIGMTPLSEPAPPPITNKKEDSSADSETEHTKKARTRR